MSGEYNNKLDEWYGQCPGPVQTVLEWPYTQFSEALHWITGEPDKVAGQGQVYITQGQALIDLGKDIDQIRNGLTEWSGKARTSFDGKMDTLQANFNQLGEAVKATDEILQAAAETCVEAANMIIDIVKMIIEFLLTSLAISLALAAFTFGASVAAWIATNIANGLRAVAQMVQGLTKVAQVLEKIAQMLSKIAQILKKVADILKAIKELLAILKELKSSVGMAGKLMLTGLTAAVRAPVNAAANTAINAANDAAGSDVIPNMPGGVSEGVNAGRDGAGAVGSSNDAVNAAEQNRPPGY